MANCKKEISKLCKQWFTRKAFITPSDWVEKHIRLNHRQSVHAGLYSLNRTPYFRQIYDDAINPNVRSIALLKSAQIGYSQFISNLVFYFICNKTNPIGIILPSQALAQQFSERNLHNSLESCEPLQDFKTGSCDDIRRSEFTFTSCNVKIIGGGSANKLSSNNICYLFLDEIDKFEEFTDEANVIELAIDRTISYQETNDAKIIAGSTPTLAGSSEIEKHYNEGSRSKYYVPCPHCNAKQELIFEQIKFPDCKDQDGVWDLSKVERTAHYECKHCAKAIEEKDKAKIINQGVWIDTNPKAAPDQRSYHISALYSLSLSWGYVARLFINSKNDRSRLQNFYNSILGLPWQPQISTVSEQAIDKLISLSPRYERGELPEEPQAITIAVDCQQTHFWFMTLALLKSGKQAIIDYGQLLSFDDVSRMADKQYRVNGGENLFGIYGGFMDAGYDTKNVYNFCRNSGNFFVPVFGRTSAHGLHNPIGKKDILTDGGYITIVNVNDDIFSKDVLLSSLSLGNRDNVLFPANADNILKEQLCAVSIVSKKNAKGFIAPEIISKSNNHLFDCLKYNLACQYMIRPMLEEDEAKKVEPVAAPEPEVTINVGW